MASTFDDIADSNLSNESEQLTYRNSKLQTWLADTFSKYNQKYKSPFTWKTILIGTCFWLSLGIPVIVLWHEIKQFKAQIEANQYERNGDTLQMIGAEFSASTDLYYSSSPTPSSIEVEQIVEEKLEQSFKSFKSTFQKKWDNCKCQRGEKGEQGLQGPIGPSGLPGNIGITGLPGHAGERGESGLQGVKGDAGHPGIPGYAGMKGDKGETGSAGVSGLPGMAGTTGRTGEKGEKGVQGVKGDMGHSGVPGNTGMKGEKGDFGLRGVPGYVGQKGEQGNPGRFFG